MSRVVDAYTTCNGKYAEDQPRGLKSGTPRTRFFALFQVAFSLPIGFSASLEGSVIEMNPAALAAEDSALRLKLSELNHAITFEKKNP